MITDVPSPVDFQAIGTQLLNLAWDTAISLLLDIDEARYSDLETKEITDAFWSAAKIQLSTALAIAQQGSEFLLKGRIAEITPFLLLGSTPKDWPARAGTKDVPFSDFRTIDAQDLLKVHNAVTSQKLPDEFAMQFENIRRKRNSVMHSVDQHLSVHVTELILAVLSINEYVGKGCPWTRIRHKYLQESPLSQMHSEDYADYRLAREFNIIRDLLQPSELKRYFDFDSKQRAYTCPNCAYSLASESELQPKTAILKPNTPDSVAIWCFVCDEVQKIERLPCGSEDCNGNVISLDWARCLTCGG